MKKRTLSFLFLGILMLMLSACSAKIKDAKYTPLPQLQHDEKMSDVEVEKLPKKDFRQAIDLEKYDNPYFKTELKDGSLVVKIDYLELWDDFADINSEDEDDKKEAGRRHELNEILKQSRSFSASTPILAVWELPCSTEKDAGDARALIKTEDGDFYIVDLVSEDKMGEIEAKRLKDLKDLDEIKLIWATTGIYSAEEKTAGEDFLIVKNAEGEIISEIPLN